MINMRYYYVVVKAGCPVTLPCSEWTVGPWMQLGIDDNRFSDQPVFGDCEFVHVSLLCCEDFICGELEQKRV